MNEQNKQSAMVEFHDLMLKEVRVGIQSVRTDVGEYRKENAATQAKLDAHISACDQRRQKWEQKHDATPQATPALASESAIFSKKRIIRKMFDGITEHFGLILVITIIQMCLFALNHGFHPSLGTP